MYEIIYKQKKRYLYNVKETPVKEEIEEDDSIQNKKEVRSTVQKEEKGILYMYLHNVLLL